MTEHPRGVGISVKVEEGWEAVEDSDTQGYTLCPSQASVVLPLNKRNRSMYLGPVWGLLTGSTLHEESYLNRRAAMI